MDYIITGCTCNVLWYSCFSYNDQVTVHGHGDNDYHMMILYDSRSITDSNSNTKLRSLHDTGMLNTNHYGTCHVTRVIVHVVS